MTLIKCSHCGVTISKVLRALYIIFYCQILCFSIHAQDARFVDMGFNDKMGNKLYWLKDDVGRTSDNSEALLANTQSTFTYAEATTAAKNVHYSIPSLNDFERLVENCTVSIDHEDVTYTLNDNYCDMPYWIQGNWKRSSDSSGEIIFNIKGYYYHIYGEYGSFKHSYGKIEISDGKLVLANRVFTIDASNHTLVSSYGEVYENKSRPKSIEKSILKFRSKINGAIIKFVIEPNIEEDMAQTRTAKNQLITLLTDVPVNRYWTNTLCEESQQKNYVVTWSEAEDACGAEPLNKTKKAKLRLVKRGNIGETKQPNNRTTTSVSSSVNKHTETAQTITSPETMIDSISEIPNIMPFFELVGDVKTVKYQNSMYSPFISALQSAQMVGYSPVGDTDSFLIEFSPYRAWEIKPISDWVGNAYFQYDGNTITQKFKSDEGFDKNSSSVKIDFKDVKIIALDVDRRFTQQHYDLDYADWKLSSYQVITQQMGDIYKTNYLLLSEDLDHKGNWIERKWKISGSVYHGNEDLDGEPIDENEVTERRIIEYYNPNDTTNTAKERASLSPRINADGRKMVKTVKAYQWRKGEYKLEKVFTMEYNDRDEFVKFYCDPGNGCPSTYIRKGNIVKANIYGLSECKFQINPHGKIVSGEKHSYDTDGKISKPDSYYTTYSFEYNERGCLNLMTEKTLYYEKNKGYTESKSDRVYIQCIYKDGGVYYKHGGINIKGKDYVTQCDNNKSRQYNTDAVYDINFNIEAITLSNFTQTYYPIMLTEWCPTFPEYWLKSILNINNRTVVWYYGYDERGNVITIDAPYSDGNPNMRYEIEYVY